MPLTSIRQDRGSLSPTRDEFERCWPWFSLAPPTNFLAAIEMIKTSFVLSVAILAAAPAIGSASAAEMPKELRGTWCYRDGTAQEDIYRRCRVADSEAAMSVSARKFFVGEGMLCTPPLAITSYSGGYFVRARCYDTDTGFIEFISKDTPSRVVLQRWRLFNNGRRLEIRDAKALP